MAFHVEIIAMIAMIDMIGISYDSYDSATSLPTAILFFSFLTYILGDISFISPT